MRFICERCVLESKQGRYSVLNLGGIFVSVFLFLFIGIFIDHVIPNSNQLV